MLEVRGRMFHDRGSIVDVRGSISEDRGTVLDVRSSIFAVRHFCSSDPRIFRKHPSVVWRSSHSFVAFFANRHGNAAFRSNGGRAIHPGDHENGYRSSGDHIGKRMCPRLLDAKIDDIRPTGSH